MKRIFLLIAIIIAGSSHAVLAMETYGVTDQHLKDVMHLAVIINSHNLRAYEQYVGKKNLPYDALQPLSDYNQDILTNLCEEARVLNASQMSLLHQFDCQIAAHRLIEESLISLLKKQQPMHVAAEKKNLEDRTRLAEYDLIYGDGERHLCSANSTQENLLASK